MGQSFEHSPTFLQAQVLWEYFHSFCSPQVKDTFIVCGSYDTRVMDAALSAMESSVNTDNQVHTIIITGNQGNWTNQFLEIPEAHYFFNTHLNSLASLYAHCYLHESSEEISVRTHLKSLIQDGYPSEIQLEGLKIIFETEALNFGQNFEYSKALMPELQSASIFTKPHSALRAKLTAEQKWPELEFTIQAPELCYPQDIHPLMGYLGLINELVGDVDRVIQYPAFGYMAAHDLPEYVLAAFEYLKSKGFVQHLI